MRTPYGWLNRYFAAALWAAAVCAALIVGGGCEKAGPQDAAAGRHATPAAAGASDASTPGASAPNPAPAIPRKPDAAELPPVAKPTGTFVDRHPDATLRLVSYNILWNSVFAETSPTLADRFVRVMRALDPDIVALQEIGVREFLLREDPNMHPWDADDVAKLMDMILPLDDGRHWHAHKGSDNVIVARWPLKMTRTATDPRGDTDQAIALIDLPDDRFPVDFYVMNNHYKCCDPEKNDVRRQEQSDAIVNWIRDARTPGGVIDLPPRTAIAVVGDLNIVGSFQPVTTLVTGDIADEAKYGADFAPDWDDTPLTDLHPLHNIEGPDDYTWRNDAEPYDPGRLDYIIYTDSVLEVLHAFVLNTTTMTDEALQKAGLQRLDVAVDAVGRNFDHLPLVADFHVLE